MTLLTTTAELAELCDELAEEPFVALDTEFMRDRTYWPKLCLIQLAGERRHAAVDPLAAEIDLQPLFELLADPAVLKVFHAARQDVEIFHHLTGQVPLPLFDTQLAAMVCGRYEPYLLVVADHLHLAAGRGARSPVPISWPGIRSPP